MKQLACLLMLAFLVTGTVVAGEAEAEAAVTLEGTVLCAKCAFEEEGRKKCQNVLVVEEDGEKMHYYLTATEANKDFGDVSMKSPTVRVTGTVSEKDGRTWLDATKIEPVES